MIWFPIVIVGSMAILRMDITAISLLINNDTVSISAEMAGFVFAGMSIFISLDGNKKMQTIKKLEVDIIIYYILILSILFLVKITNSYDNKPLIDSIGTKAIS